VKLVENAAAPFAGVDVQIDDLTLATEQLADGYVKVHLTNGRVTARTHHDELSPYVQQASGLEIDQRPFVANFATSHPFDSDPFVVAIRRDGNWYVSAAYTALEYVRAANNLSPADYGSGLTARLGADTPEAAAREFVTALGANQWDKVFSLLPPDELPLYDYRVGLAELFNRQEWGYTVSSLDATAETHGNAATVKVTARGTFGPGEEPESWDLAENCIRETYSGEGAGGRYGFCVSDRGVLPISLFSEPVSGTGPATVQAVEREGRWYLSPVATSLQFLDGWVSNFDERTLASITRNYADLPSDGPLTLGQPLTVQSEGWELAYAYSFEGTAGQQVVGTSKGTTNEFPGAMSTYIIGPDGKEVGDSWGLLDGTAVTLPATGTYKLVVVPYRSGSFTLWDVKDAPKGALSPIEDGCTYDAGTGETTCTASGSASSGSSSGSVTATTAPDASSFEGPVPTSVAPRP
jgi:hypothetical protein